MRMVFHADGDGIAAFELPAAEILRRAVGTPVERGIADGLAGAAHDDGRFVALLLCMHFGMHRSAPVAAGLLRAGSSL